MAAEVQPYSLASEEGRAFWFLDTLMFVKATGEQTGGMLGMIEQVLPAGSETSYHVHHAEDEYWYVLEGEVTFISEANQHTAVKQDFPFAECQFDTSAFRVQIGNATLDPDFLSGTITSKGLALTWELAYDGDSTPLLLLPINLYEGRFPAAKSLVSRPLARFNGNLSINDETIIVKDWVGSQNHNWGTRHTDLYAWGQVAGFDTHPDSFLEVVTTKVRLGPFWTPSITPLVLRHHEKEYALTGLAQAVRAQGRFVYFTWEFRSKTPDVEFDGQFSAPSQAFVGLNYYNPPGGSKHCLNSKIAGCKLHLKDKATRTTEILETKHRAAFEILTDDRSHGIALAA
jgi:hypothetical protein